MNHGRRIAVVGLGYVGLPVVVAFARQGNEVVAFDTSQERIKALQSGMDVTGEAAAGEILAPSIRYTCTEADLGAADFYIVAVPTPITTTNKPDMSMVIAACNTVGRQLKPGDIAVFESTVYPGASEEECIPVLEEASGLSYPTDFTIGYSPERINPGDTKHRLETVVKVVAGSDPATLDIVARVYESIVEAGVFRARSIRVAEAAKVIENTQRDLNIALMNELAIIFQRLGIDTSEVLSAAATKWNFHHYSPGLVGGHCIGIDPFYLTYKAEQVGYHPEVILSGRRINDQMGSFVARETIKSVLRSKRSNDISVIVLGFTFKEDVPDFRNTRVVDVATELLSFGASVQVHDPLADSEAVSQAYNINLVSFDGLVAADAVILAVPHEMYRDGGWPLISSLLKENCGVVSDVRGCLDRDQVPDRISLWRL